VLVGIAGHSGTKTSLGRAVSIARSKCPTAAGMSWRAAVGASHMVRSTPHMVMARAATPAFEWSLVQRNGSG